MKQVTARAFLDTVASIADEFRRFIELNCEAFEPDPAAKARRLDAVADPVTGYRAFCETYFPHYHEKPANLLHLALYDRLPAMARETGGHKEAWVSPRGSAKSTKISLQFVLYVAALRLYRFPVLISDASEQAELLLEAIKAELEVNPRLAHDFPEFVGQGRLWRQNEIVTRNDVRIIALGSGKKIRGRRHGPFRPDLVILDDVENDENVESPKQRDKLEGWIDKAVIKSGPADGSIDVLMVGTILHFDSVLARKAKKPGWRHHQFAAIETWPDRTDLWEKFEEIALNEQDDSYARARAFHAENRTEMERGAVLLWPEMMPLLDLMIEKVEGFETFMSERQNEPIARDNPFRVVPFWVMKRHDWLFFGAIDPSLGKANRHRDPSAILVGGYARDTGILDVVEASIRRRLPDVIMDDALAMQRDYHCQLWFVEAVQFQELLRTDLMKKAAKLGLAMPCVPIVPIADKTLRIERLQPPVSSGLIRLHPSQRSLLDQLQQWPNADHDDGPDCLEMLWTNALLYAGTALDGGGMRSASGGGGRDVFGGYRF